MELPILNSRKELLRKTQNADGGWGYFAGRQSWLEPTFYAMLALDGEPAGERAWNLVKSWQNADGGWRPSAQVTNSSWVTALGVSLCTIQGDYGRSFEQGVRWILSTTGAESSFLSRTIHSLFRRGKDRDTSNRGWPFFQNTNAWVEPTALSLVALRRASARFHDRELGERLREGENLLLTVRCSDGGWNYGSAFALDVNLPSYPETTALALLGLGKRAPDGYRPAPKTQSQSRMANAWLRIAVGETTDFDPPAQAPPDLMIAALEAIAASGGGRQFFQVQEAAWAG